jgi:uncharacterized RDD family membrane protein YckC
MPAPRPEPARRAKLIFTMPTTETRVPPLLANAAGAKPAPVLLRAVALVLDLILAGLVAMLLLSRLILPAQVPNYSDIIDHQMQEWTAESNQLAAGQWPNLAPDSDTLDLYGTIIETLFLVFLAYFSGSEIGMRGATLGKRVFGLRAARWGTADPPNWLESFLRCIFKCASLMSPLILLVDALPVAFKSSRRAIHDYLARTIVTGDALPPVAKERDEPYDF